MVKMGKAEIAFNKPKFELDFSKKGAPPGTVPIGDSGFYVPDDKPVDPTDCEQWPSSPWCGGNPFDKRPVAIDVDTSIHPCGVDVTIGGVIGFVKTPEFTLAYRFPGECRNDPPPPEPPPPPTPGVNTVTGLDNFDGFDNDEYVYAFVCSFGNDGSAESDWGATGVSFTCPGEINPAHPERGTPPVSGLANIVEYNGERHQLKSYYWEPDAFHYYVDDSGAVAYSVHRGVTTVWDSSVTPTDDYWTSWEGFVVQGYINYGRVKTLKAVLQWGAAHPENIYSHENTTVFQVIGVGCKKGNKYKNNPPPPPPPKDCDCMKCCNDATGDNDALLRQILAEIKKANKAIGSDQFPATFPKGLTKANRDTGQNVPDVANLLKQMVLYLDEVTGQYSIEIQVDDINPTQEGNQSQTFELKNQAETLAEMFGMMINNSMNSELMIQLCVKSLIETGVMRQQLHNTQSQVRTVTEYLGYKAQEKSEDVPFTFTVPQNDNINNFKMDDFLKSSQQKVEILKLDPKEVGKHRVYMLMLEKTAGIIKALFWRNLGKDAAQVAGKVRDLLKKQDATIKQVDKHDAELESVLEDFEKGYTDFTPYVGDSSKPYGEDYTARPKTRIIKKGTSSGGTTTP